jgi:cobalamin biosynthesis Co2+ chelatase CbiK
MKFYIFDYSPKDELFVRREIKKLKSRNPEIVEFDLYEMMLDIIEEEGYSEDIQRLESEYEKDLLLREVFQPLLSVEEDHNSFLDKFKNTVSDDGKSIVLITGVGKAFPIIRSHTILNNLQSIFRRTPVVMMYPGRYEIKNAMTMRLFERLDDDNYYRAFPLVERRRGNDY